LLELPLLLLGAVAVDAYLRGREGLEELVVVVQVQPKLLTETERQGL
jgi:hypothetical protein